MALDKDAILDAVGALTVLKRSLAFPQLQLQLPAAQAAAQLLRLKSKPSSPLC